MHFEKKPSELSSLVGSNATRFSVLVVSASDPRAELGRSVEAEVFGEVFGNDAELLRAEYDRFDPQSIFIIILDHQASLPVGVMRLIRPGTEGLKSVNDVELLWGETAESACGRLPFSVDMSSMVDVATLAVLKPYRRGQDGFLAALALYRAVGQLCPRAGLTHGLGIVDVKALTSLNAVTGDVVTPIPGLEPVSYLDSPLSVAGVWDIHGHADRSRAEMPGVHALFYGEAVSLPDLSEPVWKDAAALFRD